MNDNNQTNDNQSPLLDVKDLNVAFFLRQGIVKAVNNVNLQIKRGETLGIVGESGCGKSVTSLALIRLINEPGRILSGEVHLNGHDILKLSAREMRNIRGDRISMIFQDPMTCLNPVMSIGKQMTETLIKNKKVKKKEALERAEFMLKEVGIPTPKRQLSAYPHELSGGMRQRIMIAMALICEPELLIADEPTTALDVTIQAQILELMKELQEKFHTAIIMITHDLGIIAEMADNVAVMYAGDIVEKADVDTLFDDPSHPYTKGLMKAIPSTSELLSSEERLYNIPGSVPPLIDLPPGCKFAARCSEAFDKCVKSRPELIEKENHSIRCYLYE